MKVPRKKDDAGLEMTAEAFRRWRKTLGMTQKDAAEALGLKRRVVQYYEKGERKGKAVEIPLTVRLACYALSTEVLDYAGPDEEGFAVTRVVRPKTKRKTAKQNAAAKPGDDAKPATREPAN
ncbi:helix-turn-helix domain-containing protein [Algihabitans albus]|uniref:helix-turn-helix domain-containing protein n=1 Tax=Algihabitans albus TaxID=2164067 RepID=UPI001F41FEBC|nr:helix-turn-helix transcriptional regulator [Algihabitans albus]